MTNDHSVTKGTILTQQVPSAIEYPLPFAPSPTPTKLIMLLSNQIPLKRPKCLVNRVEQDTYQYNLQWLLTDDLLGVMGVFEQLEEFQCRVDIADIYVDTRNLAKI